MGQIGLTGRSPSCYIPRMDSFYVRAAIKAALGIEIGVCRLEALMLEEGMYVLDEAKGKVLRSRSYP
jgi:hypothetical protein